MEIKMVPIGKIKQYTNNPRFNEKAVPRVADSITRFGFRNPILVDKNCVIICGHTRLEAAKSLGRKTVPVIYAKDLSTEKVNALRLADNKTAEFSEWNMELLLQELEGVGDDQEAIESLFRDELEAMNRFEPEERDMPDLPSGEKSPYEQMAFILSTAQAITVRKAMAKAITAGGFFDTGNKNKNGNALARFAEAYLG